MSALGTLLILFIALLILVVIGVSALFIFKNKKVHCTFFILLAVLTMIISYFGATSLPSNYIFQQIVAWAWGLLAIASLGVYFLSAKYAKYAKFLLAFTAIAAMLDLFLA